MKSIRFGLVGLTALAFTTQAQAFVITSFDPAAVFDSNPATLDANVGMTPDPGAVEDFEDGTLISGLTVTQDGGLPFDPLLIYTSFPQGNWDGGALYGTNIGLGKTEFALTVPGVESFGIGIGDVETNVEFLVNGVVMGLVRDLTGYSRTTDNGREVYLVIDAEAGESISTVAFQGSIADLIMWDHLTYSTVSPSESGVPFEGQALLLGLGLLALAVRRQVA